MQLEKDTLQIVVVGGGSVGLLYAARLARSGQAVTIVTRSSLQSNQLMQNGLCYQQLDGEKSVVSIVAQPIEMGLPHADVYLLSVKQTDLPDLLPPLKDLPAKARVVALQNGMGHQELLAQILPQRQCFFAINTEGARRLSATEVMHTGSGLLRMGPWESGMQADAVMQAFVDALQEAGVNAQLEASIKPYAWRKLMANALINPLTALFDIPNGALLENPQTLQLMRELFLEASAVASAHGQKMKETDWQEIVTICRNTSRNLSSMLQDVKRQKQTEVEAINGYLVKRGREAGIPTPLHDVLLRLVLLKTDVGIGKEGGDRK
ncbi:ketopantoate reductase family protein [Brevibacillus choshinensis]|uniref:2-dehydropantoate 2-reductase n=1 Tax=Brevibacillus choshinensis TaxID=54911 RepID=A0ABX7FJI1_BRECH|nr:2-dehydropantoate 2-reductase [Brevibacillus choshinensis]QRG65780.1 2-dehydropantoate 2-reductase [Brevibacillus choshinensis]